MEDITDLVLNYRKIVMGIWNEHYIIDTSIHKDFIHEIDFAFARIEEGLFDSLVIAKSFDTSRGRVNNDFYDDIIVKPITSDIKALAAKQVRISFNWEAVEEMTDDCVFKYIDLFDWSIEKGMDGEFIRAKLVESPSMKEYVGFDFLFNYDEVQIFNSRD